MKPVDQEFYNNKDIIGDCVRAVTASILELELKDVPHFCKEYHNNWYYKWVNFMYEHGIILKIKIGPWKNNIPIPKEYYLASGTVKRGGKHMIIMKGGKLVHDPHPSRAGLIHIENIWRL